MSEFTFTVRPAEAADLDGLWPMVQRAVAKMNAQGSEQWGSDYPTRNHYAADIAAGQLWVAAGGGQVYGVAMMTDAVEENYRPVHWAVAGPALVIHRMAVDPALQRAGVASALFRHAEDLARAGDIPTIHVDTYGKNQGMQALLLSRGFQKRGEIQLHGRPMAFPCFEKVLE